MTESTERLSAALADRYRIERRLGEGGMAISCQRPAARNQLLLIYILDQRWPRR